MRAFVASGCERTEHCFFSRALGKTPTLATICRDAVQTWTGRVLVASQVKELLEQPAQEMPPAAPAKPPSPFPGSAQIPFIHLSAGIVVPRALPTASRRLSKYFSRNYT